MQIGYLITVILLLLIYVPLGLIINQNLKFHWGLKCLFILTAPPVFLAIMVVNVILMEAIFPGSVDLILNIGGARKGRALVIICFSCPLPILFSYFYYRLIKFINSFLGKEKVSENHKENIKDVDDELIARSDRALFFFSSILLLLPTAGEYAYYNERKRLGIELCVWEYLEIGFWFSFFCLMVFFGLKNIQSFVFGKSTYSSNSAIDRKILIIALILFCLWLVILTINGLNGRTIIFKS